MRRNHAAIDVTSAIDGKNTKAARGCGGWNNETVPDDVVLEIRPCRQGIEDDAVATVACPNARITYEDTINYSRENGTGGAGKEIKCSNGICHAGTWANSTGRTKPHHLDW